MNIKFAGFTLLAFCGFANALVTLERSPLFVRPPVDPNIVLSFDDSGSMFYAVTPNEAWDNNLPRAAGAGLCNWRDFPHLYASDANTQYFDPLVTYVPPVRQDGTSFPDANFTAAYLDGFAAYRTGGSLAVQTMNLATGYLPSMRFSPNTGIADGTNSVVQFANAATTTGCQSGNQETDTTQRRPWVTANVADARPTFQRAFYYSYIGPRSGPNGNPTTFEIYGHNGSGTDPVGINNYQSAQYKPFLVTPAQETNFANWYSYYRSRVLMGRTAATVAFAQLPRNVRISWQGINGDSVTNRIIKKIEDTTHRTNFYTYLHNVRATGGTPTRSATTRVGNYFSDAPAGNSGFSEVNPYYDVTIANALRDANAPASLVSCRQNYHMIFTDGGWKDDVGAYNDKNFDQTATTFPDGTAYPASVSATPPSDPKHTNIYTNGPNQANIGGYADVAFDYWRRDLKSSLTNNVQPFVEDKTTGITTPTPLATLPSNPLSVPEIYWNPKNNPATWQHVVQYVVAFGLTSSLDFPSDLDKLRRGDPRLPTPAVAPFDYQWTRWDNVENSDPNVKVDDTWHAALNSRGELLGASNPQELVAQMNSVFQSISARTSSVSAISISSSFLTAGTLSFRTFFKANSWSGSVQAERFLANGTKEIAWDAACRLDGGPCQSMVGNPTFAKPDPVSGRNIYSSNGTAGINFTFGSLSPEQQTALNFNWDNAAPDAKGLERVAFLRGERSLEGATFRGRESVLGAVVNSNAVYISGALDEYWAKDEVANDATHPKFPNNAPSDLSSAPETKTNFRAHHDAIANRTPMIYAGANDGMLHAFDAATGAEVWAYVPYTGYKELSRLTSKSKLFTQSSVDSTPVAREVFTNSAWRTLLVGAMRMGGQGIFALDITSPTAGSAGSKFLWEFRDTSAGGADLGYTYGRPAITRLKANKKWVVLLPGGYNSDETVLPGSLPLVNDTAIGAGRAVLFVLDAMNGTLIQKIDLGAGTEGLSSIVAGDYIFDDAAVIAGTQKKYRTTGTNAKFSYYNDEVTDVAFAGDNNGAIWRFNLEDSNSANWTAVKMFQAAANQRITAQPRVVDPKNNGLAKVIFGTGRFIATADRTNSDQQAVYGLYDAGPNGYAIPIMQANLQNKPVTTVAGVNGIRLVRVSNAAILSSKVGWWFNLPFAGERVIAAAGLLSASNRVIISSFTPTKDAALANDPCVENSESTLYIFNPDTGGPISSPSVDTNGDGFIDSSDDALVSGYTTPGYVGAVTPVTFAGGGNLGLLVPDPVGVTPAPPVPYCTANPGAAKCVACALDPTSEQCICLTSGNCPAGGLPTFIWRRTTARELPAWDNNDL